MLGTDAWIRFAWPVELRRMRAAVADLVVMPPPLPDPDEIEHATRQLRWLLERCAEGVTLTQSGYVPPTLVAEGADTFGWWPFDGKPRSEVDVHQFQVLRDMARRLRLVSRRGRRLAATKAGRRILDEPVGLWRAVALGVGSFDEFSRAVGELVALRLLAAPAESVDLEAAVVPGAAARRSPPSWSSVYGGPLWATPPTANSCRKVNAPVDRVTGREKALHALEEVKGCWSPPDEADPG